MLLHGKVQSSSVNGPGERAVLWYAGCTLGCDGCWNPATHEFDKSKRVSLLEISLWLKSLPEDSAGITFSGGDPMQHFNDTLEIVKWVKQERPQWTIGMFTGYSYKEVVAGKWNYYVDMISQTQSPTFTGTPEKWIELESKIDFAIMGRYNKLLTINSPLVTTSNQELKLFSDRYTENDFKPQAIEITIDANGDLTLTGFPVGTDLSDFKNEK